LEKIRNERAIAHLPDWVKRVLALLFHGHPPHIMVCPKLFAHLRRRGIAVWFLNVQDEHELDIAVKAGATGVLTDRVEWLNRTMRDKSLSFKAIYE
jgi:glycerophosphoryl diester phosphodiesterase